MTLMTRKMITNLPFADNTNDDDNDDGDDYDDVDEEDKPALVVDHPDRKVARVDAEVERDAPHYDQPQFQPW